MSDELLRGHNDIARVLRDYLGELGYNDEDLRGWDAAIYRFANGYNGVPARAAVIRVFIAEYPDYRRATSLGKEPT